MKIKDGEKLYYLHKDGLFYEFIVCNLRIYIKNNKIDSFSFEGYREEEPDNPYLFDNTCIGEVVFDYEQMQRMIIR